jgi:hypothetical protein
MFNVTLTMSKEETEACLKASKEAEEIALEWLNQIRANIRTLELALRPGYTQAVLSETYPDTVYTVTRKYDMFNNIYECNCPSFKYARGLDGDNHCKHIRYAISRPFYWKVGK